MTKTTLPNEVREAMDAAALATMRAKRVMLADTHGQYSAADVAREINDAALSALEAAGWVCVPREPTIAMQEAVARIPIRVGLEYPTHIPTAYVKEILAVLLTASNPKEKPDV